MIKSTLKEKEVKQEQIKFELEEAFVLWKQEGKNGGTYLSGFATSNKERLIGYFNSKKENPKEPDIRVFDLNEDGQRKNEIAVLWENLDKKGGKYLTGKTTYENVENVKLVAWYGKENQEARPFIRCYFK